MQALLVLASNALRKAGSKANAQYGEGTGVLVETSFGYAQTMLKKKKQGQDEKVWAPLYHAQFSFNSHHSYRSLRVITLPREINKYRKNPKHVTYIDLSPPGHQNHSTYPETKKRGTIIH